MNHEFEFAVWKSEIQDISGKQRNRGIGRQVRTFPRECRRISREDGCVRSELFKSIYMGKTLNQPTAEEARPAGYKEPLATHLLPEVLRVHQNETQVFS
jgi:hypothetical protein